MPDVPHSSTRPAPPPEAEKVFGSRLDIARRYAGLLAEAGVERGLIGPREVYRLWSRHLLNCAAVAELIPHRAAVVDIGSGAGLPGLVLAITRPDLDVTLVESRLRPTTFLSESVKELGLSRTTVRRARAEDVADEIVADVVTARAVSSLGRLVEWGAPMLSAGGQLLALKGEKADEELAETTRVLEHYGLREAEVVSVEVPGDEVPTTVIRARRAAYRRASATRAR